MNVDAYLDRIGLHARPPATLAGLTAIHRAHSLAIPYENLDVQFGRLVTIERPAIYEKIVTKKRGGWCYEMNGIMGWALGELGFNVTRATGSVMREASGDFSNGNHLVLRVELSEGLYLADVGFGDGPRNPIRVVPGAFHADGFDFSLRRVDDRWWRLNNDPRGGAPSFDFNLDHKMTSEEIAKAEELVNGWIAEDLPVSFKLYPTQEALDMGAIGPFGERYADEVKVYQMGEGDHIASLEICGGPHVDHTAQLAEDGKKFKITKEESSSAGIRRIKAVLV